MVWCVCVCDVSGICVVCVCVCVSVCVSVCMCEGDYQREVPENHEKTNSTKETKLFGELELIMCGNRVFGRV